MNELAYMGPRRGLVYITPGSRYFYEQDERTWWQRFVASWLIVDVDDFDVPLKFHSVVH